MSIKIRGVISQDASCHCTDCGVDVDSTGMRCPQCADIVVRGIEKRFPEERSLCNSCSVRELTKTGDLDDSECDDCEIKQLRADLETEKVNKKIMQETIDRMATELDNERAEKSRLENEIVQNYLRTLGKRGRGK